MTGTVEFDSRKVTAGGLFLALPGARTDGHDFATTAIAAGADTFDCVAPTRLARRGGVYTLDGRMNLTNARFKRDFAGVDEEFGGYVSENYSRAYLHHLLKAKEFLAGTLCTLSLIHI